MKAVNCFIYYNFLVLALEFCYLVIPIYCFLGETMDMITKLRKTISKGNLILT